MHGEFSDVDHDHMRRALVLARRGQGRVEPNPMVGCVLAKGRRIIGEGHHRVFGGPHAEVEALSRVRQSTRGATAYVTLEPCCHYGKTPPCTDALIEAGIRRVVAAMLDPNEPVNGKGAKRLRRAGIRVEVGLLEDRAALLNRPYLTVLGERRPYIILKWAQSLDGKIATRTGDSKWISSPPSRRMVHTLRARMDAIVVGIGTVLRDDPLLTARDVPVRRMARRVVLDTRLRIPETCQLVATATQVPLQIFTSTHGVRTGSGKVAHLSRLGVAVRSCRTRAGQLSVLPVLRTLARDGCSNVLVEGGGRVLGAFLDSGAVDEAYVFVSPKLMGGVDAPGAWLGRGVGAVRDAMTPARVVTRRSGDDMLYHLVFS